REAAHPTRVPPARPGKPASHPSLLLGFVSGRRKNSLGIERTHAGPNDRHRGTAIEDLLECDRPLHGRGELNVVIGRIQARCPAVTLVTVRAAGAAGGSYSLVTMSPVFLPFTMSLFGVLLARNQSLPGPPNS